MNSSRHDRNQDDDSSVAADSSESRFGFVELRTRKIAVLADQKCGWAAGKPASPEKLLEGWPTNPRDDADVAIARLLGHILL